MGKRGPAKTPKEINELNGNPGRRPQTNVRDAPEGEVIRPDWLESDAVKVWDHLASELKKVKLMKPMYAYAFAMYCEAIAEFINCYKRIQEEGVDIVTTNGNVIQNPVVGTKSKAADRANKLGQQFGFSPSAWASLEIPADDSDKSEKENKFFNNE